MSDVIEPASPSARRAGIVRQRATEMHANIVAAMNHYIDLRRAILKEEDEIETARLAVKMALAFEQLASHAASAEKETRAALATWFEETGAPSIKVDDWTVSLVTRGPQVVVSDSKLVPAKFMVPQPPKPDMVAIKAAWADNERPPGVMETNGGASHIQIKARSGKK